MGSRRRQVLALMSDDPVLRWVGPIGLALAAGTALIIDAGTARAPSTRRTLEDFVDAGPRLAELSPGRRGVATIPAGRLSGSTLRDVMEVLAGSWPALVIRTDRPSPAFPTVPYRGLYPGLDREAHPATSVWQPAFAVRTGSLPGPILPRIGRRDLLWMLDGRTPTARRWVNAWRGVWEMPWA